MQQRFLDKPSCPQVLDAEQLEVDKQLSILERRLRETSEDDTLVYDALLQQFLTLVNRKNALMKRQDQLNMLDKEADLEKKLAMLQEELRALSELEEDRKTDDDRKREDLLLEELVECVKKRNELVIMPLATISKEQIHHYVCIFSVLVKICPVP